MREAKAYKRLIFYKLYQKKNCSLIKPKPETAFGNDFNQTHFWLEVIKEEFFSSFC